jgi:hypothetical protein
MSEIASNGGNLYQDTHSISANHQEIHNAAMQDMDFFAGLALPLVAQYEYPDLFKELWYLLISYTYKIRDFSKIAVGLPRGFGKTSVVKLFILWCILFSNRRFIVVINDIREKAEQTIADIVGMLNEPNIISVFGDWRIGIETDRLDLKIFSYRGRKIILKAEGQGGSIRGLVINNQRPDIMLFDDIQTKDDADSMPVSEKIENWMIGTAMKAAAHTGCLYIFLANMYPTPNSILRKLKSNPSWIKFIVGALLANGESLWPAHKPVAQLLAEYKSDCLAGKEEIFLAEVLNDENANINKKLDLDLLPPYPYGPNEISAGNFIIIDPATDKANADAVTITVNSMIGGRPVVMIIEEGRYSPEKIITRSIDLAIQHQCSVIFVESNAFQYSLCYWFNKYINLLGLYGLVIQDIYSGKSSKTSRILTMFKAWTAGELYIHPKYAPLAVSQAVQFNPLKTDNADGILDCITYLTPVLTNYSQLITVNNPLRLGYSEEVAEVWETSII